MRSAARWRVWLGVSRATATDRGRMARCTWPRWATRRGERGKKSVLNRFLCVAGEGDGQASGAEEGPNGEREGRGTQDKGGMGCCFCGWLSSLFLCSQFPITAIREIKVSEKIGIQFARSDLFFEQILRALNHPNIINLIEVVTSKSSKQGGGGGKGTSIYMVFEAMSHDLTGLMESEYSKHFSQGQVKCYMQQLFEALNYCHRNAILHRDIK